MLDGPVTEESNVAQSEIFGPTAAAQRFGSST